MFCSPAGAKYPFSFWAPAHGLLELEKDFIELKDKELKDRELKVEKEIEELFFKPLIRLQKIWIDLNKKK